MSLNSEIILVSGMKIDKQYTNVLSYSESQMLALCRQKQVASGNKYSFLRPTNSLYVDFTYSQCLQANYIAFQNTDYSNKWFFAWIDEVIYKGEKNCEIRYTVDAWSTWFDYWTKKPCYILREHVNDDTIGLHTIPENLDIGEVVETFEEYDTSYDDTYGFWVAVESSYLILPNSSESSLVKGVQFSGVSVFNKCVFGNRIFLFKILNISDFANISRFISRTNKDGFVEDIKNMWIVPNAVVTVADLTQVTASVKENDVDVNFTYYVVSDNNTSKTFNTIINKVTSYTGLTIKNNKCFVYPYNYLFVSNNNGNNNIYKYEDFSSSNCVFENILALSIGISGRLVPKNYKGVSYNVDESLPLGKYPTCSWSSDAYTNWLTENAVNIPTKILENVVQTVSNPIGEISSMPSKIANILGGFRQASLLPNIQGGSNTGDVLWSSQNIKFTFKGFRTKDEYIKVIDDYFTRFGYKINRVKEPNIIGRTYWNYIEIGSGENIGYGTAPANFMETINNACRKGVTIWHNHDNIGNYNLNNTIVQN